MAPSQGINAHPTSKAASKSKHLADSILLPFLTPAFDPAQFLNTTLPSLIPQNQNARNPRSSTIKQSPPPSITELSNQIQTLLSQLNAQTSRLSNTLTQLTDDILRSGGRLAYEVEVLRGETRGLTEILLDGLTKDVANFVPDGLSVSVTATNDSPAAADNIDSTVTNGEVGRTNKVSADTELPTSLLELQRLTRIRNRLESVTKVFGQAMEWVIPPSETSFTSSFISVSAPEPGAENFSQEEKGQEVTQKLKEEITGLLESSGDPSEGIILARKRIEELRELVTVWKGTIEEKPRIKLVDTLAKSVNDKEKTLDVISKTEGSGGNNTITPSSATSAAATASSHGGFGLGGFGLMTQLQKIRDGR
jgi:hypothetical protein